MAQRRLILAALCLAAGGLFGCRASPRDADTPAACPGRERVEVVAARLTGRGDWLLDVLLSRDGAVIGRRQLSPIERAGEPNLSEARSAILAATKPRAFSGVGGDSPGRPSDHPWRPVEPPIALCVDAAALLADAPMLEGTTASLAQAPVATAERIVANVVATRASPSRGQNLQIMLSRGALPERLGGFPAGGFTSREAELIRAIWEATSDTLSPDLEVRSDSITDPPWHSLSRPVRIEVPRSALDPSGSWDFETWKLIEPVR